MLTQTGGYKNEVSEKMRNEIIVVRAPDIEQDFFSAAEVRAEGGEEQVGPPKRRFVRRNMRQPRSPKNLCHRRGSPQFFRPASLQFKGRANGQKVP